LKPILHRLVSEAKMGTVSRLVWLSIIIAVIAIFLNYPPPDMSQNLTNWQKSGHYFDHHQFRIFYQGKNKLFTIFFWLKYIVKPLEFINCIIAWTNRLMHIQICFNDTNYSEWKSNTMKDGPVLICFHGFPSTSHDWMKVSST